MPHYIRPGTVIRLRKLGRIVAIAVYSHQRECSVNKIPCNDLEFMQVLDTWRNATGINSDLTLESENLAVPVVTPVLGLSTVTINGKHYSEQLPTPMAYMATANAAESWLRHTHPLPH